MQVFVELSDFAATATRDQLHDMVRALEDSGAHGVSFSDHLFYTADDRPRTEYVEPGSDPLTMMAAVLALSDILAVQSTVMNTAWLHPALLLRQFSQLAVLAGGNRVTAGLGAGWSAEEFDALGLELPAFRPRLERFAEVLAFAHDLYNTGTASNEGEHFTARDLPLSPRPSVPPRLLVGGGSDRILGLAATYADIIDLHGDPRHAKLVGATMEQAKSADIRRRALTTVNELAERYTIVESLAADAGRPTGSVSSSTQIWYVAIGDRTQVAIAEHELCESWAGTPDRSLADCPYVLLGEPRQIADSLAERRERYGLQRISLTGSKGIAAAPPDPLGFCRDVIPFL